MAGRTAPEKLTLGNKSHFVNIRAYEEKHRDAVISLWRDCGLIVPQNDPEKDIARKLEVNPELFLVGLVDLLLVDETGFEKLFLQRGHAPLRHLRFSGTGCGAGR